MICKKCGELVPNGNSFCSACGTPAPSSPFMRPADLGTPAAPPAPAETPAAPPVHTEPKKPKGKGLILGVIAGIAAIAAVCLLLFWILNGENRDEDSEKESSSQTGENDSDNAGSNKKGRGVEETVELFIDGTFGLQYESARKVTHDKVFEALLAESGADESEYRTSTEEEYDELREFFEDYDMEYRGYSIEKTEERDEKEFEKLKQKYEERFGVTIDEALAVKVNVIFYYAGNDEEAADPMDLFLVKIGKSYYIDTVSMGSVFD